MDDPHKNMLSLYDSIMYRALTVDVEYHGTLETSAQYVDARLICVPTTVTE